MRRVKKNPINILGAKLKTNREVNQLSKNDVAEELSEFNVTETQIDEWEKGYDTPDEKVMYRMAELYGISVDDLLKVKNDIEIGSQKVAKMPLRKKFVGKTFWDIFGDLIIGLIKILVFAAIIYYMVKYDVFHKLIKKMESDNSNNTVRENYIVEDEYLKMLNGGTTTNENNTNK